MTMNNKWVYVFALLFMLIAIPAGIFLAVNAQHEGVEKLANPTETIENPQIQTPTIQITKDILPTKEQPTSDTPEVETQSTQKPTVIQNPAAESWKEWPVLPNYVSDELKQVYKQGLAMGNNPNAFSIFGDCHSLPEVFFGVFDSDPDFVKTFDSSVQETVANFQGSFDRYSPTVKIGTTEGALLWPLWNDNEEGYCENNENAIDCELRVHQPSIVFIRVGTHYESRNEQYLIRIIDNLLEKGVVPILVTKADNRELDERINETLVRLAAQYDLPVWNFWASVQHLDTKGIDPNDDMYLADEAYEIHKVDGIKVLDFVWHELNSDEN